MPRSACSILRRYPDAANLESAFWRGFGSSVEVMGFTNREFEALVAGRGLMLMNELQVMNTADLAAIRGPSHHRDGEAFAAFFGHRHVRS